MEFVSKKVLIFLCSLFLIAALAEGFLLYKDRVNRRFDLTSPEFDFSHPFAFHKMPFMPWNMFPRNLPRSLNDDSFFGSNFPKGDFLSESFVLSEPRREDSGSQVKLIFDVKGHEKANFDVKVSGGQLTLTGKDDQKTQKSEKHFWPWSEKDEEPQVLGETHWSQTQSFPLPDDVDPKGYSIERTQGQFVVVFKKLKGDSQSESKENL